MAQSTRRARVSVRVQVAALCLLLACLLQNAAVYSSENDPSPLEEERDIVMEKTEPLVETEPDETEPVEAEGLPLEVRMALPDPDPKTQAVDKNKVIDTVYDAEGAVELVYWANRSELIRNKKYRLILLDIKDKKNPVIIGKDFYPKDYPIDRILRALHKATAVYATLFAKEIYVPPIDPPTGRKNGPNDVYLCSSRISQEYPLFDRISNATIVNVDGFYQGITFDVCDQVGAPCNHACPSNDTGFLVCDQNYGTMEVVVAREKEEGGEMELRLERMNYPSGCKCRRL